MTRPTGNTAKTLYRTIIRFEYETRLEKLSDRTAHDYALDTQWFFEWLLADKAGRTLTKSDLVDGGEALAGELGVDLDAVDRDTVIDFLAALDGRKQSVSKSRIRRLIAALSRYYKWRVDTKKITANPVDGVARPSEEKPVTTYYTDDEVDQILAHARVAIDQTKTAKARRRGWVDYVALAIMRYAGPRAEETQNIELVHVNLDAARLEIRRGKGGKTRYIPIPPELVAILDEYLRDVRPQLPGDRYLLSNPYGFEGSEMYGRMSKQAICDATKTHGNAAGVGGRHYAHRYRHTYAVTLWNHGADLETIRDVLGHADIATTRRYLHITSVDQTRKIQGLWDRRRETATSLGCGSSRLRRDRRRRRAASATLPAPPGMLPDQGTGER